VNYLVMRVKIYFYSVMVVKIRMHVIIGSWFVAAVLMWHDGDRFSLEKFLIYAGIWDAVLSFFGLIGAWPNVPIRLMLLSWGVGAVWIFGEFRLAVALK